MPDNKKDFLQEQFGDMLDERTRRLALDRVKRKVAEKSTHTIPFRMHINDWRQVRQLLFDDGLTFQAFAAAMVDAYVRGNVYIGRVIREWQEMQGAPEYVKEHLKKIQLSPRERNALLNEIQERPHASGSI